MNTTLGVCLCPSDPSSPVPGFGRMNYRFNLGPTPWNAPWSGIEGSIGPGPFSVFRVFGPADFADGLSNTVGVSERLQGDWLKGTFHRGGDYRFAPTDTNTFRDADWAVRHCQDAAASGGVGVESRGGEDWFQTGLHFTNYNHCARPNVDFDCAFDAEVENTHSRTMHSGVFSASSAHPGGVLTLRMDGSARFTGDGIDLRVWRALATRSGGEVIPGD